MSPPSTSPAAPSPPRPAHDYHHQHHQQQQHHYQLQRPSIPEQLRLPVPNTVAPGPISPTGTPSSGSAHSASQLHPHYHHHYHLQGPHYPGHTQQHNARHGYVDSPLPSPTGPPPSLCSDTTSTTSSSASPSVAASYESSPSATITTPRTGVPVLSAALARGPFFRLPEPSTANLKPTAYDGHQSQLQQYSPPLSPLSVHRQEQQRVPSPPREAGPTLPPILGGGGSRPAASTAFLGMVLN